MTSSEMENNVREVNERCSVFLLPFYLLNFNFNSLKQYRDDKEQGICIEKVIVSKSSFSKLNVLYTWWVQPNLTHSCGIARKPDKNGNKVWCK